MSGDQFESDPMRTSIKSAILAFVLMLVNGFIERDEHVIYSDASLEEEIIKEIEKRGYSAKKSQDDVLIFSKSAFWNRKRFKLTKTNHYLKLALPEEFVSDFEKYVR